MKNEKSLKNDKRAVSPVIGVILMVAITVILAAVIAAFVFGMGPPKETPVLQIQATTGTLNQEIVLDHAGGETVEWDDLRIQTSTDGGASDPWADITGVNPAMAGKSYSPGDTVVATSADAADTVVTIRILHKTSGGLLLKVDVKTGVT